MKKLLMIAFLMALPVGALAQAFTDSVTWVHPTTRVDGTPLPAAEIARTEVRVKRTDGSVVATASVAAPATEYVYNRGAAPYGTICYDARTVDTAGLVSDWSLEVCKTVKARPNRPSEFDVK